MKQSEKIQNFLLVLDQFISAKIELNHIYNLWLHQNYDFAVENAKVHHTHCYDKLMLSLIGLLDDKTI